jgi:endonuclease-3
MVSRPPAGRPIPIFFHLVALRISSERYRLRQRLAISDEESNRYGTGAALSANPSKLALALKPGGLVPIRLREIAERIQKEFGGGAVLNGLSIVQGRAALKSFPRIADPGVDRILLFAGISPVAAVPSNCAQVLVRIQFGQENENYGRTYRQAQRTIEAQVPATFDARRRAYLLLKCHGQQLCKRTKPKCSAWPLSTSCSHFAGKTSVLS